MISTVEDAHLANIMRRLLTDISVAYGASRDGRWFWLDGGCAVTPEESALVERLVATASECCDDDDCKCP